MLNAMVGATVAPARTWRAQVRRWVGEVHVTVWVALRQKLRQRVGPASPMVAGELRAERRRASVGAADSALWGRSCETPQRRCPRRAGDRELQDGAQVDAKMASKAHTR